MRPNGRWLGVLLRLVLAGWLPLPLCAMPARAAEEILDYRSHVRIERDGTILVTETIRVRAEGYQIKRGIFRWFPVRYKASWGARVKIPFDVVRVLRDGKPEPWHTRSEGDGTSVYIGDANVRLQRGIYTYTLMFRTARQIGFFKDYDELYFNAIGHKWLFTILKAEVTVEAPKGAQILFWSAFTGAVGSRDRSYDARRDASGNLTFTTTHRLYPRQGMTIVVRFPKGVVAPPGDLRRFVWFLWDDISRAILLVGLIVVALYFFVMWLRVGRDPRRGTIIPHYAPPKGMSPAACRYVLKMGYDRKGFAAAVVDMAVKGVLRISQKNGTFSLTRIGGDRRALSDGERAIDNKLFGSSNSIELNSGSAFRMGAAIVGLRAALAGEYEKGYFNRNRRQFVIGALLSGAFALTAAVTLDTAGSAFAIFLTIWTGFFLFIVWRGPGMWRAGNRVAPILFGIFLLPSAIVLVVLGSSALDDLPLIVLAGFALLGALNILFFELMKAPTREGRRLLDEIEGFRMYLAVGEKERLDLVNAPEETPALFETYLPYALALDVETRWAERFAGVLDRAGRLPGSTAGGYIPAWYVASDSAFTSISGLADTLGGSFANATASASVAPGTSGGSSGGGDSGSFSSSSDSGGFSGGGGGGGGGGGW